MSSYSINSNIKKKSKTLFLVFYFKKYIFSLLFICFIICLVLFSNSNLIAAKNGLKLWANNVIPSLLPFFIATELLSYTNVAQKMSLLLTKFMRPLFNVPGSGAYAFILGTISGYPVGAKIVTSLRNLNNCTKDEGNRMLAFTNNSGPLFIIGTIGITLFRSSSIGFLLLITHLLSSITIGIILGIISKLKNKNKSVSAGNNLKKDNKICNLRNLGEILSISILNSIKTILLIGGFIVLFSVIVSILNQSKFINIFSFIFYPICKIFNINTSFISSILTGLIELTNGVALISSIPSKSLTINIVICSFLLGFGGLSVLLQVLSIISKSDLSIKTYFYAKLLQGIISAFYTYILIINFSFLNFNL